MWYQSGQWFISIMLIIVSEDPRIFDQKKKILTCTAKLFGNSVLAVIIHAFAANASVLRASFARKTRYSSSEIVFVSPTTGAIIRNLLFSHPCVLAKLHTTTDYVYDTRACLCMTTAIFDPRLPLVLVFLLNVR